MCVVAVVVVMVRLCVNLKTNFRTIASCQRQKAASWTKKKKKRLRGRARERERKITQSIKEWDICLSVVQMASSNWSISEYIQIDLTHTSLSLSHSLSLSQIKHHPISIVRSNKFVRSQLGHSRRHSHKNQSWQINVADLSVDKFSGF